MGEDIAWAQQVEDVGHQLARLDAADMHHELAVRAGLLASHDGAPERLSAMLGDHVLRHAHRPRKRRWWCTDPIRRFEPGAPGVGRLAQALHAALPEADLWFWDVDERARGFVGLRVFLIGPAPQLRCAVLGRAGSSMACIRRLSWLVMVLRG
jgi:hypothetical protein